MNLLAKLRARLPDWLWAGLVSGVAAFVATFAPLSLGWLASVADWANANGTTDFPSLSILTYGAVAATVALGAAVVNAVYRWAQSKTSLVPGTGPTYTKEN